MDLAYLIHTKESSSGTFTRNTHYFLVLADKEHHHNYSKRNNRQIWA